MAVPAVGRKVRDASEAEKLLAAWSRSGVPMATWCAARGINWYSLSAFKGWPRRKPRPTATFLEVEVQAAPVRHVPASASRYRVVLGERIVEVDSDFEEQVLRRLVRAVEAC